MASVRNLNPGHTGGRRALSPLCHPCSPNRLFLIADLSSPVCLFCGSRYTAKVYLLDINKKEMRTLDGDVSNQSHCFSLVHLTHAPCPCFGTSIWCRNRWARAVCNQPDFSSTRHQIRASHINLQERGDCLDCFGNILSIHYFCDTVEASSCQKTWLIIAVICTAWAAVKFKSQKKYYRCFVVSRGRILFPDVIISTII